MILVVVLLIMLSLVLSTLSHTNSIISRSRRSIRLCPIRLYASSDSDDNNDKIDNISKGFSRKVFENNMPR